MSCTNEACVTPSYLFSPTPSSPTFLADSSVFAFLDDDLGTVLVSLGFVFITGLSFTVARMSLMLNKANADTAKLLRRNQEILNELMNERLNKDQVEMVEANKSQIEDVVPASYELSYREIKFQARLGAGSFGDCYKGLKGSRPVAIKRMRVTLVDEAGFKAFSREVIMLSTVEHPNIVGFVGYSKDPFLLIVMDFISGGTLCDFVEERGARSPLGMETTVGILIGAATGFAYLHAQLPMPILHRDIKSENILLTDDLEARVADLGEARVMAADRAMTVVGTNGYTAPEVLRGEHYGTTADVFSFSVVMYELLAMRKPYEDIMRDETGHVTMSWDQVAALTSKKEGGLRPSLPEGMDEVASNLITRCWSSEPDLRPSFPVIIAHLDACLLKHGQKRALSSKRRLERAARSTFRSFHDLMWVAKSKDWRESDALRLIDPGCTACAKNETLNEILHAVEGPACITSLAHLMFGALEDGSEIGRFALTDRWRDRESAIIFCPPSPSPYCPFLPPSLPLARSLSYCPPPPLLPSSFTPVPEPLLDEDILIDIDKLVGYITFTFGVKAPYKEYEPTQEDQDDIFGLGRVLLDARRALQPSPSPALQDAIAKSEAKADGKPGRKLKRKKRRSFSSEVQKNRELQTFMNAVRCVLLLLLLQLLLLLLLLCGFSSHLILSAPTQMFEEWVRARSIRLPS